MTTLGLLQYVSPTIQFLLGIWLFREPFSATRLIGFVLIWVALVLYSLDSWQRRSAPIVVAD
jgi:chloramphenicol-sensitive protein RarD